MTENVPLASVKYLPFGWTGSWWIIGKSSTDISYSEGQDGASASFIAGDGAKKV